MATDGAAAELAEELLGLICEAEPLFPTILGLPGYDDRLADMSAEAEQRYRTALSGLADRADEDAASTVDDGAALTATVMAQQARAQVDKLDARAVEYAISDRLGSAVTEFLMLLPMGLVACTTAPRSS